MYFEFIPEFNIEKLKNSYTSKQSRNDIVIQEFFKDKDRYLEQIIDKLMDINIQTRFAGDDVFGKNQLTGRLPNGQKIRIFPSFRQLSQNEKQMTILVRLDLRE